MTTKVVLVQPYYENIWEPNGLGFIAGYLKEHFMDAEVDVEYYKNKTDFETSISSIKTQTTEARLVFISASTAVP